MVLTVKLGAQVQANIEGHSAINGAKMPDDAALTASSNDETVATIPSPITIPPGGTEGLAVSMTVLGVGSTDIHVTLVLADGTVFEDTSTLIVEPTPEPGLVRISITLIETP